MPYIIPQRRKHIDKALAKVSWIDMDRGDLTYLIYLAGLLFVEKGRERSYTTLSAAMSSMRDAEAEFRRIELDPYEKEKRRMNGPVTVGEES